jgi:hypothetical protein
MGQYYKFIILADNKKNNNEVILLVINPHDFMEGAKLMEHSYINTNIMNTVEFLIGPLGPFNKSRCVWAGDYADDETNINQNDSDNNSSELESLNLYRLADNYSSFESVYKNQNYKYIVNHTKKLYVDKTKLEKPIHPLPLLISEGNGKGGGDYNGNNYDLCGTWARDVISMENEITNDYEELICDFYEY